ncbi:NmrA family [Seminavis robusta]|uniref:NmrA family n=1 Tax=Seminavis robusta TaxID=568900 RepID=A0A9N8EG56_9STRA|nr:NmrA family [Seminavis robusta]|eukprot:Sro1031_g233400.1 NmrA family (310) ;mRNA; r:6300-7229
MVKIAVITGSSASGLACMQRLLVSNSGISLVRGCFRRQGIAATRPSSLPLRNATSKYESVAHIDAADVDSLRRALQGMDRALLVTPLDYKAGVQQDAQKSINMIQAAHEVGVQRIVHVGSWTVKAPTQLPILSSRFAPTEDYLREEIGDKMEWTVLRGGYFMPNFAHVHGEAIQAKGQLLPLPDCQIPPVDVDDIGHAAAALLEKDDDNFSQYHQAFVECCGPELLSHSAIATELGAGLDTPITYPTADAPPLQEWTSENPILSELYHYMAEGEGNHIPYDPDPVFAKILGRPLTTLGQWAAENKHSFA